MRLDDFELHFSHNDNFIYVIGLGRQEVDFDMRESINGHTVVTETEQSNWFGQAW